MTKVDRGSAFEALKKVTSEITVTSMVELAKMGSDPASEAVVTAACCALANMDDYVQANNKALSQDLPWPHVMQVLAKPSVFLTSLRRFPYAVDAGRIPKENVAGALHFLELAGRGTGVRHSCARRVLCWVEHAVTYWECSNEPVSLVKNVAARVLPGSSVSSRERLCATSPDTPARPRDPSVSKTPGRPLDPSMSITPGRTRMAHHPAAPPKAERTQQSPLSRRVPPGSMSPTVPFRLSSPSPDGSRHATPLRPQRTCATPQRSRRVGATGSATPGSPPMGGLKTGSARPAGSPPKDRGSLTAPPRPIASPQRGLHSSSLVQRRVSKPTEEVSKIGREHVDGARSPLKGGDHVVRRGVSRADTPGEGDLQGALDESAKEVRELRSIESQLLWQMRREEKKEQMAQEQAAEAELLDWRWKQSIAMKTSAAEREEERKRSLLQNSKESVELKRERKAAQKARELEQARELYLKDRDHAALQALVEKRHQERNRDILAYRCQDVNEMREMKRSQRSLESLHEDNTRSHEQRLMMATMARELSREKERLLESLHQLRQAQRERDHPLEMPLVAN